MLLDWLWLTTRKNLGVRRIHMLLDKYGSPEEIYRAPAQDMEMLVGRQAAASLQDKSMDEAEQIAQACFRLDVRAVTIRDASYPQRLRSVDDAPVVLYYQGRLPQFELMPAIAMVGTRRPSGYGFMKARQFGTWLGEYGVIVVSGGAAGVDTECLSGALEADAPVVAVLGCGGDAPNTYNQKVYAFGLVTIGENSVIPSGVRIGRNTAILGETTAEDYPNGELPSGGSIIRTDMKEGEIS